MNRMTYKEFLEHYGVKGMKWGVRKSKAELRRQSQNDRVKTQRQQVAKNRRTLKDEDLDKYISRLEKERKLKTLTDETIAPGKTFIRNVMTNAGRTALTTIATGAALYSVRVALTREFDVREAASYLKPKKK